MRERNTYAWSKRAWLMSATGDDDGAVSATARARELAGQIQAATVA